MRKAVILTGLIFLISVRLSFAARQYHIRLNIPEAHDSAVFLAHYYGKPRPDILIVDSARLTNNGTADLYGKDTNFVGGIYILIIGKSTDFEFVLNAGDDISVTTHITRTPEGLKPGKISFGNSPENERFETFVELSNELNADREKMRTELLTNEQQAALGKKISELSQKIIDYRHDCIKNYPGTFLADLYNVMEPPPAPQGPHYLPDGKTPDDGFAFRYYKSHYWDSFNFRDDRLICTPLYDGFITKYFAQFVVPSPDSFEHESDMLLSRTRGSKNLFHYTLGWLTNYAEESRAQGMDSALLYLLENYYQKGYATWLTPAGLEQVNSMAHGIRYPQGIEGNRIGNNAPDILLPNIQSGKTESLRGMDAKYTLLVFFSPNCGHCQAEMPHLDSLYKAVLKDKGVKVFTVVTEGDARQINDFIAEYKIEDWANHWDPAHTSNCRNRYEAYITPEIYLLDEQKRIIGKHLNYTNIMKLLDQSKSH